MRVLLKPRFSRLFDDLPEELQHEALKKIGLFADPKNHKDLRVHPLHGTLKGCFAFSVNFRIRIVFAYQDKRKQTAILLAIGDHTIYE